VRIWIVAAALVFAGCNFNIRALTLVDDSDLAVAGGAADLAMPSTADLGPADLSVQSPPDLRPDPCAGAPALGVNNVAAQCVIGTPPTIDGDLSDWPMAQFLPVTKAVAAQANGTWDTGVANDVN